MCPIIAGADDTKTKTLSGNPPVQRHESDARALIRRKALSLGFDAVGIAPAHLQPQARDQLMAFLKAGYQGDMGWLESRIDERSNPQTLWPAARSVIVVGFSYAPATDPLEMLAAPSRGSISVYARNRDYHSVMKGMLKHLGQFITSRFDSAFKVFVDTAPVMEKPLAQRGGVGWQGKHTNLVSRSFGSWLLLGEVYTSLEVPPDTVENDHCGSCVKCLQACPTKAFPAPYQLDAKRCISYLTIEHSGPIPLELRPLMGNRIYGCDDCLAVCPWNRFASATPHEALIGRSDRAGPDLAELAALDDKTFRATFSGSPIKRTGRNRFVRNVLVAIGNSKVLSLKPAAARLIGDADPVVADTARWACDQLDGCAAAASSANSKALP
jgi:epoxyqueuosine reductase